MSSKFDRIFMDGTVTQVIQRNFLGVSLTWLSSFFKVLSGSGVGRRRTVPLSFAVAGVSAAAAGASTTGESSITELPSSGSTRLALKQSPLCARSKYVMLPSNETYITSINARGDYDTNPRALYYFSRYN